MTNAILMYHRVCARTPETECYFERGTAVTPEVFRAQMVWLGRRYVFRTVRDLVFGAHVEAPSVAVTFDDGYRDIVENALPVCRELGATATAYVCSAVIDRGAAPLWFDRYYALVTHLLAGTVPPDVHELIAAETGGAALVDDLRWWVRGPLKERLITLDEEQRRSLLDALASAAQVSTVGLTTPTYVDRHDLRALRKEGWEIGGHGATHSRMTQLGFDALAAELAASAQVLVEVGAQKPWTFAYPDGAVDARVTEAAAAAGFDGGVTVEAALLGPSTPRQLLPRLLCRGSMEVPHPTFLQPPFAPTFAMPPVEP